MAVYVRDGQQARHVNLWCAADGCSTRYVGPRTWQTDTGGVIRLVPNRGPRGGPACSACLVGAPPLDPIPEVPRALAEAIAGHRRGAPIVYDLRHPASRTAQVGSGAPGRVLARWRATVRRGRLGPDAIWWLYDLAAAGHLHELTASVIGPFASPSEALQHEDALRERLRSQGRQVSSNV